jgi:DNA-binding MarR family transcriptional regulator
MITGMNRIDRTEEGRLPLRRENVLLQMFRTGLPLRELMARAVAGTGVTADEYAVLGVVGAFGPIAPSELSARLGMPRTSMSRYMARLLEEGLVARSSNPNDGRSYLVDVTPRGRTIVQTIAPRIRETLDALAEASSIPLADIGAGLIALEDAGWAVVGAETSTER